MVANAAADRPDAADPADADRALFVSYENDDTTDWGAVDRTAMHPRLLDLLDLWERHCGAARLPCRKLADPVSLRRWLGSLQLVEVVDGGRDFLYRVHGTWLVEMFGRDLTGKRLSDFDYPTARVWAEYRTAVERRQPLGICGKRLVERDYRIVDQLILPLGGKGSGVDRLLIGVMPAQQSPTPTGRVRARQTSAPPVLYPCRGNAGR